MRTGFDRDRLVDDVTLDPSGRCQTDLQATYAAHDAAIYHDVICDDFAFDGCRFADGQQMRPNVAFNCAFNLNVTGRLHVAGDV